MRIGYCQYSGAGNTFVLVDNRSEIFPYTQSSKCCDRLNVDGLILLEKSSVADFRLRIFNRDGSEAEMCGNGLRCFIKFLEKLGFQQKKWCIETLAGIQLAWSQGDEVCVQMPSPCLMRWHLLIKIGQENHRLHQLTVGVPHVIKFVDDIDNVEVDTLGEKLSHHPLFGSTGTNVTFVALRSAKSIRIRTYERGVERETLACGTGAVAAALATAKLNSLASGMTVYVRSDEQIKVSFPSSWDQITMQGPVKHIDDGFLTVEL